MKPSFSFKLTPFEILVQFILWNNEILNIYTIIFIQLIKKNRQVALLFLYL